MSMRSNDEGNRHPLAVGRPISRPPVQPVPTAPSPVVAPDSVGDADEKKKKKKKKKDKLGSARGIETMFRTSYRTHIDMSALADTKANIMISINGIILSIIIASISPKIDANPWLLLPTAVLLIGCLISLVYAILAARPRVSSLPLTLEDVREKRANILFFGNFVNLPRDDYVQGMKELLMDTDALYINMIQDIYSLGGVLSRKFNFLRVSYAVFMGALVAGVLLFVGVLTYVALTAGATPTPTGLDLLGPSGS